MDALLRQFMGSLTLEPRGKPQPQPQEEEDLSPSGVLHAHEASSDGSSSDEEFGVSAGLDERFADGNAKGTPAADYLYAACPLFLAPPRRLLFECQIDL